jgi:hypothetical protein
MKFFNCRLSLILSFCYEESRDHISDIFRNWYNTKTLTFGWWVNSDRPGFE